jgi:hypothetical protein
VGTPRPTAEAPDPGSLQIGCALAFVGAVLGDLIATVVLVIVHPDEVFLSGVDLTTAIIALAIGWVVAVGIAVIISAIVIGVGLTSVVGRLARQHREPLPLLAAAWLVGSMTIAGAALWLLAGSGT